MTKKQTPETTDKRNLHLQFECENLEKFKKNKNENLKEKKNYANQPTNQRKNRSGLNVKIELQLN